MKRRLLSRSASIATRQRVYSVPDGLEIDEVDHFEVRRWRVLYEDVVLVTYHRFRGTATLVVLAVIVLFAALVTWVTSFTQPLAAGYIGALLVAPIAIVFVICMVFGVDEINVYSRRSHARMRFPFRKRHARAIFDEVTRAARLRQRVAPAAAPPPPAPPPAAATPETGMP